MKLSLMPLFLLILNFGMGQYMKVQYSLIRTLPVVAQGKTYDPYIFHYDYYSLYWGSQLYAYAYSLDLEKYPDGKIEVHEGNMHRGTRFSSKPIQLVEWINYDSMHISSVDDLAMTAEYDSCVGPHSLWKFGPNVEHWEFLQENKKINGLNCQRAKKYYPDGSLMWEVWFAPEILVPGNPMSMYNLPGLMVLAESSALHLKFELQSLEMLDPNGPKPYLPPCINDYFPYKGTMKPVQPKNQQKQ